MPSSSKVPNPHDRFFKESFRHHSVAVAEINRMLPNRILDHLDLNGLSLDETELMDARLASLLSDRLYRVPLKSGGDLFVWFLVEHQSSDEPMMGLRLLEYAGARWRAYRLMHPEAKRIPLMLPIVIQHDSSGWTGPVMFSDLYQADSTLLEYVGSHAINFAFWLDDLQAEDDEALAAQCPSVTLRAVLLALKHGGAIPVDDAPKWHDLFDGLSIEGHDDLIWLLVWYLLERGSEPVVDQIKKEVPKVEQAARTILDDTFDEGRIEGRNEGRVEGAIGMLREMLSDFPGFDFNSDVEVRLQSASYEDLKTWTKRIFLGEEPRQVLGLRTVD